MTLTLHPAKDKLWDLRPGKGRLPVPCVFDSMGFFVQPAYEAFSYAVSSEWSLTHSITTGCARAVPPRSRCGAVQPTTYPRSPWHGGYGGMA